MIFRHARACLRTAAHRPLSLLAAVALPVLMVPILSVGRELPLLLQVLVAAGVGGLADLLVQGLLSRHDRWPRGDELGPAMPTLPISRRARAMGEALAAAPVLALGGVMAAAVASRVLLPWSLQRGATLSDATLPALVAPLVLLPAVLGASLQAGRGAPAQLLAMGLPGAVTVLAWRLGWLQSGWVLPGLTVAVGASLLAMGPLPRLSWPGPGLWAGALSRPAHPPRVTLARDLGQGLLRAHLRASPMALVALIPWAMTGSNADLGPGFHGAIGAGAVALGAAFMPLGRTPLGTGAPRLSPWAHLPLDRHVLARRLYAHALVCLLALPVALVILLIAWGRLESFAVPVLGVLGLSLAPAIAAALLSWWLAGWQRVVLAGLGALGLLWLALQALAAESVWALVGLGVASVVAGVAPVGDLLAPWRLAPREENGIAEVNP